MAFLTPALPWIGLGMSALGFVGTMARVRGEAAAETASITQAIEAGRLERARDALHARREGETLQARRVATLAAQGGMAGGGLTELLMDPVTAVELARAERETDIGLQEGMLVRRGQFVRRGARAATLGALGQFGAQAVSLLGR